MTNCGDTPLSVEKGKAFAQGIFIEFRKFYFKFIRVWEINSHSRLQSLNTEIKMIRKNKSKRDLALIYSEKKANAAAVYTTNLVKGAPLAVTKAHIANGVAQA